MTRVFVYGTLKRGGGNHGFLARQRFVGEARTHPGYVLYSLGDYPGMVQEATDQVGVTGELWEIDDSVLQQLDELEGVAAGLFRRITLTLAPPHDGSTVTTYLYARNVAGQTRIGPNWHE
ncbi:MAG: gamma-glutamylcyclotransferase [Opitutaceae bacterium]|nr:gamma-glutamylcyclotransferase [Opitutaceae bacterium]